MESGIIEIIRTILAYLLSIQVMYGFLIFLLGRLMSDFYATAIYENPNNLYKKVVNFIMAITIGSGYYINLKLKKFSWIVRKFLFLIALAIQSIASIIIYQIIYNGLKAVFL